MNGARVAIDLAAGQIVTPGSTIGLEFSPPLDACHPSNVRLVTNGKSRELELHLSEDGHFGKVRLPEKVSGACELYVTDPDDGKNASRAPRRIPFSIIAVSGQVGREHRIGQVVRLREGELGFQRLRADDSEGPYVDVVKVTPKGSGPVRRLAFDQQGAEVDFNAAVARVETRRADRFGRIDETLYARMEQLDPQQLLDVVIWAPVSLSPAPYPLSAYERSHERSAEEAAILEDVARQVAQLRELLNEARVKWFEASMDYIVPYVHAVAQVEQIRALAQRPEVGGIYLDDPDGADDLAKSLKLSRADGVIAGGTEGANVKVAVWERGPSSTSDLAIEDHYGGGAKSAHARLTTAIIKNRQAGPRGYAPESIVYSADSYGYAAFEWALQQGCTVVNQSFHRREAPLTGILDLDDHKKDWAANLSPRPTIVQASGNFIHNPLGSDFVNHKGFNTLTVGSHDESLQIAFDSVYRNPDSSHGDRELPTLVANGTTVDAVNEFASGTSFAAPAVAGVVALLQSQASILETWPEGCRAIVIASARRPAQLSTTWLQDVQGADDARFGAGCLDAQAAQDIVLKRSFPSGPSSSVGWDVGTLTSSSFDADGRLSAIYTMIVPAAHTPKVATIALCWNSAILSRPFRPTASILSVDLNLEIREAVSGDVEAISGSLDNSYEVVEFYPAPGHTYELTITRASGTDDVRFGIAWIVRDY